jgi:hypothetical protein
MNVLCDFVGHADLYYSMHALFEQRLGYTLYRPYGKGWKQRGVTSAFGPPDSTPKRQTDGTYHMYVPTHDYTQRGVGPKKFDEMDFKIIVSTSWENEVPLYKVHKKRPGSIFIRHLANIGETPSLECPVNVLRSILTPMPSNVDYIQYCPEHLPRYCPPANPTDNKVIKSFSNDLRSYPPDIEMWDRAQLVLSDYTFYMHGHGGDHKGVPQQHLAKSMQDAMFIWHVKGNGCCGYVAREALACGKPLIVNKVYCEIHQTLALDYLQDGVNCIDLNPKVRSLGQGLQMIREWSKPGVYEKKCQDALRTFEKDLNFEREAKAIKKWINKKLKGVP